jgi:hypothetical protein
MAAAAATKTVADIFENQIDKATEVFESAISAVEGQIEESRAFGRAKAEKIFDGFGFDSKLASNVKDMTGATGEMVATGMTLGAAPMAIMLGAAKGVYNKVTA